MLLRLMGLVAVVLLASPALAAEEPVLIAWPDLIPVPDEPVIPRGLIPDEMAPDAPASTPYDPNSRRRGRAWRHGPGDARRDRSERFGDPI